MYTPMRDSINLKDLPEHLLKKITERLHTHSTSLFKLALNTSGEATSLHVGSGTFANIAGVDGILTATHVADKLDGNCRLGLLADREGASHNFSIGMDAVTIDRVAKRLSDPLGPDVAFISLSEWDKVGTIRASRAFHSLDVGRQLILEDRPQLDEGLWSVCGTPDVNAG